MSVDLTLAWAAIAGFSVAMYVILDGFDLGMAMLFPFTKTEEERDQMIASVAPFWDGNETWLVFGGNALWVAFPLAFSILLPAFYIPVLIMVLALVFRGVTFEFRGLAGRRKGFWNAAFWIGSFLAAFAQGAILGGLIQGIEVADRQFAGSAFDWATPFAVLCGLGVAAGYALLGATWLIMKTDGAVALRARRQAKILLLAVLGFMALVSLWTPLAFRDIAVRWFSLPNFYYLWPVPVVTATIAFLAWRWIDADHPARPFFCTIALFLLGFLGLVISIFPFIVPPSITIWDAASTPSSQIFSLVGTLIMLPIILGYTALVYYLFRGKVRPGESYH